MEKVLCAMGEQTDAHVQSAKPYNDDWNQAGRGGSIAREVLASSSLQNHVFSDEYI